MPTPPKPLAPLDPLPILLVRARNALLGHFRPVLRAHGLSEQQWRVLRCLSDQDVTDISQLAEMADLLHSSLSRMLTEMERRGLVRRVASQTDARRCEVVLAPAGRALVDELQAAVQRVHDAVDARLGAKRATALRDALIRFIEDMESDEPLVLD